MEKLIELLNEYREKELGYRVPEWEEKGQLGITNEQLISKKFGFIEWLVENEKLTTDFAVKESGLNAIIMLLAVAPNPISFLISLLK